MLLDLYPELQCKILSLLPKEDLEKLSLCSKQCNLIAQPLLWTGKLIPYDQLLTPLPKPVSFCCELFLYQKGKPQSCHKQLMEMKKSIPAIINRCNLKVLSLDFYCPEVFADETFAALSQSRNLVEMHLRGTFPDNLIDRFISSCSEKLKVFTIKNVYNKHLEWGYITDKAFGNIARFISLEKLELELARIPTKMLKDLSELPLKQLMFFKCNFVEADVGMSYLRSAAENLENLLIHGSINVPTHSYLSDIGVKHISALVHLRELDLSGNAYIGDTGLQSICSLIELKKLDLSYTSITDKGLRNLLNLKCLVELNLAFTSIHGNTLHWLCDTAITHLNLRGTEIGDHSLKFFSHFQHLQCLDLSYCGDITDGATYHLQAACEIVDSFKELNIRNTMISSKGCSFIQSHNSVFVIYDGPAFAWLDESYEDSDDVSLYSGSDEDDWTTEDEDRDEDDSDDDDVVMAF